VARCAAPSIGTRKEVTTGQYVIGTGRGCEASGGAKSTGLPSKSSPLLRKEIVNINESFMTAREEITKSGEREREDVERGSP
jgi:hypothetical protein